MSGTVRRCLSRDRRFLEGVYGSKEIGQVGRLKVLKCLEGQGGNFEMNTLMNRKAMKFFKRGSNMVVTPNRRIDNTGKGMLHFLKPVKGYSGKTIVQ